MQKSVAVTLKLAIVLISRKQLLLFDLHIGNIVHPLYETEKNSIDSDLTSINSKMAFMCLELAKADFLQNS